MRCTKLRRGGWLLGGLFVLCIGAALSGLAQAQVAVDPRSVVSPRIADFAPASTEAISAVNTLGYATWSPDGRFIAYVSYETGSANIWITDVATKKSRQVAPADQTQRSPRWSPDSKRLLFVADDDGNEMYDIFVVDVAASKVRDLTQTPEYAETNAAWSPDGRAIAFSSRKKEASASEIAVMDMEGDKEGGRIRFLTRDSSPDRTRVISLWSPAGDFIYFDDVAYSFADADIVRVSIDGGTPQSVTPPATDVNYRLADLSPDGKLALMSSDAANGWTNVALLDIRTREIRWVTNDMAHFNAGGFSPDGEQIVFTRDEPLATHLFVYEIKTHSARQLTHGEGFHELRNGMPFRVPRVGGSYFSRDGQHVVYLREGGTTPGELMALHLRDGAQTTLVANTLSEEVARSLVKPSHVWFKSADGKFLIPAVVWMPPNLRRDGTHPAVVAIHGGPMDQMRPYFITYIQVLASRGYVVISPNYRGSINYGRAFQFANRMDLGGGDLSDVETAADWLVATGYVDAKRIAAYGGSNGGYLTLLALAKQPRKWAAGIALNPFVDYFTQYAGTAPWLQPILRHLMGGEPAKNAELWRDRSPLTHAHRISAPVLITTGANDPRCPPEQAKQMQRAIQARGGHVELKIFGEQGHGPEQTDAFIDEDTMVLEFLDEHLRPTTAKPRAAH
jgi:dipeptidyl aminopeptidase/acylaminoacyl peptidase